MSDINVCLLVVRPGPVHGLDVFSNASNVYVTFSSPKRGKTLKYNVSADCGDDGLHKVSWLTVKCSDQPSVYNCMSLILICHYMSLYATLPLESHPSTPAITSSPFFNPATSLFDMLHHVSGTSFLLHCSTSFHL